jgi:hypothetical protein
MLEDVPSDTRNLVLTLARIWAASSRRRCIRRMWLPDGAGAPPPGHQAVRARARNINHGIEDEHRDDPRDRIRPIADAIVAEIEAAVPDRARQSGSDRPRD